MSTKSPFQRINVDAARQVLTRPGVVVLDSRDPASFEKARIASATRLSSANLDGLLGSIPKTSPVLIYCYRGKGSQVHAQTFVDFGFREVFSLDGGFEAWAQANPPQAGPDEQLGGWLAEHGFEPGDVNGAGDHGITPLMRASKLGDTAIAAGLIRAGARLETRNADGCNALWMACVGAVPAALDLLIKAGIDIDNQNLNGATCLMYAASTGKAEVVAQLIAAGADVRRESLDGFTALDSASTVECLTLLRNAGRAAAVKS
jgi:thiosulfate/3-mercaptopyruvate sulfurtransferase